MCRAFLREWRWLDSFRASADNGVIGGWPQALRERVVDLVRNRYYADFGPTLACEKLAEQHGRRDFSRETLRHWMIDAGPLGSALPATCAASTSPGTGGRALGELDPDRRQ